MKWTENGIEFEGTPEEYLAIHKPVELPKRTYKRREGTHIEVIDLGGESHGFVRVKDAASYIAQKAQRNLSSITLALTKRTSDAVQLKDYIVCGKAWNTERDQEPPHV
jgi:hypothetical protein